MYLFTARATIISALLYQAEAFNFSHNDPTSCDDFTVTWTGGTPPFYLTLLPPFGTQRNVSISPDSFKDGKGSFSTQLPFPKGKQFVATMSDQTEYGSGGDTLTLTVGDSKGGSCNTTDPGVDFSFQLNTALQQCRAFTFSNYNGATQPVTIIGTIPGGDSFVLNPPNGSSSFDWTVNVWNGTQMMFLMYDSEGRRGGNSDLRTVSASDDSSCISADSPSTTATQPSSDPSNDTGSDSSSGTPIGAIAGSVLGALVFLAVCITLGLFLLRRRRDRQTPEQRVQRQSRRVRSDVDLLGPPAEPYTYSQPGDMTPAMNTPATQSFPDDRQHFDPFDSYAHSSHPSNSSHMQSAPEVTPFVAQNTGSSRYSSPSQRKSAMAGVSTYKPSRFVVHTDMEDEPSLPEQEEVIELPPQYSERRTPQASGSHTQGADPSSAVPTSPTGKRPPHPS